MDWLLERVLTSLVRKGDLEVTAAGGRIFRCGDGTGPPVAVRFASRAAQAHVLLDADLALGDAYMDGGFVVQEGSIGDFLALAAENFANGGQPWWSRPLTALRFLTRRLAQLNIRGAARRNVARHYDLDRRLYSLFLDSDWQYSCAYFSRPDMSLDDAQRAKMRHVAAKLLLKPGHRVLDIGSGWGGLARYLAEWGDARVHGVTLSREQFDEATARAAQARLSDKARFSLTDYRDISDRYDRIVSVGMFEHVGVAFYDAYFRKCADLLSEDGVFLLHSIGRTDGPGVTNPWVRKHIFPGGYIPALSEVLPAIERAGLMIADVEILRLHYAETLKAWRERFMARRDEAERLSDARFVRMWEFYLAASEQAFRADRGSLVVFQIQMTKKHGVAPVTRDYIAAAERRLEAAEGGRRPTFRLAGE